MDDSSIRNITTMCARDCPDACFLDVLVKDGKILEVKASFENPVTNGITCPRARGDPKRVSSSKRVKSPLKREGGGYGTYKKVSWEEALNFVASELKRVIKKSGSEKVLLLDYSGNTGYLTTGFTKRLWNILGVTRTDYAVCSASGHAGLELHYGLSYGIQPEEILKKETIIFWGFNAKVSSPHQWALAVRARKENNAKIISVDPRLSETAELSDNWINPRPGSDVALAYGLANWLINNARIDEEFIKNWTLGYNKFEEETQKWVPSKVERITGIEWRIVENFASKLSEESSPVFMIGIGLNKSKMGAESVRAVSLLPALLGIHRGFYYSNSRGRYIGDISLEEEAQKAKTVSQISIGKRLEEGEFGFVYVMCMNPVLTLPDSKSVIKGLKREDVFVCVQDTHLTETGNYADVILPAPTFLEKDDVVVSDCHPYVRYSHKALQPQYDSIDEVSVMKKLAEKFGVKDERVYVDPWEELRKAFTISFKNGTFQDLVNGDTLVLRYKPLKKYQTPSGKIEFYSSIALPENNPLPVQIPLSDNSDEFVLLNSSLPKWTHTQFRDVYGLIPSVAWINPSDANRLDIKTGEEVTLYNDLAELKITSVVTSKIRKGVLWTPRELKDSFNNIQNSLTPGIPQKLGGGPIFNSVRVRIKKE